MAEIRRALAESVEGFFRLKHCSLTDTWEKRIELIDGAFKSYEVAVRACLERS